jgi:hypothetical protein
VRIVVPNKPPVIEFTARIKQISMRGLLTVEFSDKIAELANYTNYNDAFLAFRVIPASSDQDSLGSSNKTENKSIAAWQIVAVRTTEMDIQLNFTDPMVISNSFVRK